MLNSISPLILLVTALLLICLNLAMYLWMKKIVSHYNALTKGVESKTLMAAIEGIQKTLSTHERSLAGVKKEIVEVQDNSKFHLRHLIFKRFNPFSDTGGDQSFMLGIMDGNKDGVVITSLHSRENTRFYVKSVKGGEGLEHPLSREEQKLVNTKE